ncbi:MAG: circularly permuted type 2 ATP-grasp protein, partial [Rhodospirillales bacterium]|nr:circularly permuted type 2 ATP-grasp protein [Rhodospirillales bacterium]
AAEQETLDRLLSTYIKPNGSYDEFLDDRGDIRPHYREIVRQMVAEEDPAMLGRRRLADGIIRKDGITYNVYGDPKGMDRPWALDLLPIILTTQDWAQIEAGVRQRVHLLNHLLADLHGHQRLIHHRVLPPEFAMANPRFLRPCHGIAPPRAGHIVRYAADLVRDASGAWRVYSDRTQAPSGAGYALENRIVMARTCPNLIQDAYVQRLANFFECYCAALRTADPQRREDPNIAMLTPGPLNETYFEHVYLARYLGYPLVEGEDLAVRDNRLYLRTVEGLEQIDVALRLVDDAFCDPLELRRDSILGPIGLLQALRSGNVAVCNAIGAGALEVGALKAIL